jgi:excisionase family DNA binding protein
MTPAMLLRPAEVAAALGFSRAQVYGLIRKRQLPSVRIGSSVRVPSEALTKWIEEHTIAPHDA